MGVIVEVSFTNSLNNRLFRGSGKVFVLLKWKLEVNTQHNTKATCTQLCLRGMRGYAVEEREKGGTIISWVSVNFLVLDPSSYFPTGWKERSCNNKNLFNLKTIISLFPFHLKHEALFLRAYCYTYICNGYVDIKGKIRIFRSTFYYKNMKYCYLWWPTQTLLLLWLLRMLWCPFHSLTYAWT